MPNRNQAGSGESGTVLGRIDEEERVAEDGRKWLRAYLCTWVQKGQGCRRNHVHQWSKLLQRIIPLAHCQKKDDITQCKIFFPRTSWLMDRAVVLRQGILVARVMPRAGRRNVTVCLEGPMHEEILNGTLPPMHSGAAGLNFNAELQIAHRIPVTEATHDTCACAERCWETDRLVDMALAAQRAQNAAAADYQCKRCAPSFQRSQRDQGRARCARGADKRPRCVVSGESPHETISE